MKSFQLTEVKPFMAGLLSGDTFHDFLFSGAELGLNCRISFDGKPNAEFLEEEVPEGAAPREFLRWDEVQDKLYDLIRGKKAPTFLKISLLFPPEKLPEAQRDWINGFVLNISYDKSGITLVTAVSSKSFATDREPDRIWDATLPKCLQQKGFTLTEL